MSCCVASAVDLVEENEETLNKEWCCDKCDNVIKEKDGQVTDDDEALFLCHACFEEHTEAEDEVDGDGFVVCGHCGKGGGSHAPEDCPEEAKNTSK